MKWMILVPLVLFGCGPTPRPPAPPTIAAAPAAPAAPARPLTRKERADAAAAEKARDAAFEERVRRTQRDQRARDYCAYQGQVASANTPGILMPIAVNNQIATSCLEYYQRNGTLPNGQLD